MAARKCKYCKKAMRVVEDAKGKYLECRPCTVINGGMSVYQTIL